MWADPGGAAGAGSPSPMKTGASTPMSQERQFSASFADYLSPGPIFAPKALYGRLAANEGSILIRKGAIFADDGAYLGRYGAPAVSRGALLARKAAFSSMTAPSK